MQRFAWLAGVLIFGLAACSSTLDQARSTIDVDLAQDVSNATLEYNEAYAKSLNSQILLNILRARDRLPRQYTTLGELALSPEADRRFEVTPTGLKLGNNGIDPWLQLSGKYGGSRTDQLNFKVTPAVSSEVQTFYNPLSGRLVQRYLDSNWSDDVLANLLFTGFYRLGGPQGVVQAPCPEAGFGKSGNIVSLDCLIVEGLTSPDRIFVYISEFNSMFCFSKSVEMCNRKIRNAPDAGDAAEVRLIPQSNLSASTENTEVNFGVSLNTTASNDLVVPDTQIGALIYCHESSVRESFKISPQAPQANYRVFSCSRHTSAEPAARCLSEDPETGACKSTESFAEAIFYIERHNGRNGGTAGFYSVGRASIDDMIYKLGETMRYRSVDDLQAYRIGGAGEMYRATSNSQVNTSLETVDISVQGPLFSIFEQSPGAKAKSQDSPCRVDDFVARVQYRGELYLAGSPEYWKEDDSYCQFQDRTGTVLTLLSQIIELSQTPDKIESANLFVR